MVFELTSLEPGYQVFASEELALEHVRDHLLTAPECFGWALIADLESQVGLEFQARRRAARQLKAREEPSQGLYELLCEVVARVFKDAACSGWSVEGASGEELLVAYGFDGVLVIVQQRVVTTAFLPGLGYAERTLAARGRDTDLPREMGMRSRGRRRRATRKTYDSERRERRREGAHREPRYESRLEEIFHKVFKPSWDFVREQDSYAFDMCGQRLTVGCDYGLLNQVLPRRTLRYADWLRLRQEARREQEQ